MARKELLSKCGLPETWRFDVSLDRVGKWREDSEGSGTGRQSAFLLLGREPDVEHIRPATARAQVPVCASLNVLQLLASGLLLVLWLAAVLCFLSISTARFE